MNEFESKKTQKNATELMSKMMQEEGATYVGGEQGSEGASNGTILPSAEYTEQVAQEDPEALERARQRLMTLIKIKAKGMGGESVAAMVQPMVYSMSTKDCEQLYKAIMRNGLAGLSKMVAKKNKETK